MRLQVPLAVLLLGAGAGAGWAQQVGQGRAHHHRAAEGVALTVEDDGEARALAVRVGPLELPARSDHLAVPQPADLHLSIPIDGWVVAYRPRLTDADGQGIPGRLLHHVAFWNTGRSDLLCPEKEEHVFGAGGEMNEWVPLPGVGYRVGRGDRIRVSTMFHNPTAQDHPEAYLEVAVEYRRASDAEAPLRNIYPVWFDVQECGRSDYDLQPGTNVSSGQFTVPYSGRLLGVGGHLHDYGRELVLENLTRGEEIARLAAELDDRGRLLSMPVVPFLDRGGYRLEAGEVVRVTARYENPTGRRLADGAMGIVVGYFLPDDDRALSALRRPGE